jgi:hypothetical protein
MGLDGVSYSLLNTVSILISGASKITRWEIWRIRTLQKQRNALLLAEIHKLTMLCVQAHCHDEAPRIQLPAVYNWNCITLFLRWSRTSTWYLWFTVTPQAVQILYELPCKNWKNDKSLYSFLYAHASFLLSWSLWHVPFLTLSLGFRVIFKKPTFITSYDPIKKIWFSFKPFKYLCWYTALILIQIFMNHLCTHFSHDLILCNSLVDWTFVKFIGVHSNCQMSIIKNESPHMVNVCASSHRGRVSRSQFIFHHFSPFYEVFVPPKYLSMW